MSLTQWLLQKCRDGEAPVKANADMRVSVRAQRTYVSTSDLVIRLNAYESLDVTFDRQGYVVSYIVRKPETQGALA